MAKHRVIHYAGSIRTPRLKILPGWAACCSGDKAEQIRLDGANTYNISEVTCKACLKVMAKDRSPLMQVFIKNRKTEEE